MQFSKAYYRKAYYVQRARQSYKLRCFSLFDIAINIRVNQAGNLIPSLYAVIASCRYVCGYIDTCVQANTNRSMHVSKRIIYVCAAGPRHGGEYDEYDELLYADLHSHSNYIAIIFRRRSFATPATGIGIGTGTGTVWPYKESGTTFVRVDIEISFKFLGTSEQVKGFS